jgi:signal transduction histidine kinase
MLFIQLNRPKSIFFAIFWIVCCCQFTWAQEARQSKEIDHIDTLIAQVPLLMRSDKKAAVNKILQIQQLSNKYKYKNGIVEGAFFRSWLKYRYESADECIKSIDSALKAFPTFPKHQTEFKFYVLKGQCYVKKAQFDQAVNNFNIAIKIADRNKDPESKTAALISIGWAYMEDSKPKEAIEFFLGVLTINPQKTYSYSPTILCNIASCYNMLTNYKLAKKYAIQGVEAAKLSNSMVDLANGLNILARSNYQQGKFDNAIQFLKEASKAREKVEDPSMLASDYLELSDVYRKINQPQQSILYAKKAEAISYVNKIDLKLASAYLALANGFEATGDYKNAARYYQKLVAHRDSTGTGDYSKALAELQVQYATEKKSTENLKLKQENLENKLSISNKQKWLIILIGTLFILSATAVYIFYLTRSRYKTRLALEQLNEQKNRTLAIMQTEESERRRIAGDLHDGVGQLLAAASLQLKNTKVDENIWNKIDDLLDQATAEVRAVSHQMTPELVLHFGLRRAIIQGVERLNDAKTKAKFTLFEHIEFEDIEDMLAVVLYRAFQELTNNVLKHAAATAVSVNLMINAEEALLMIEDNGLGFDQEELQFGLGLKNLESRIKLYDGELSIDSRKGRGTTSILKFQRPKRKHVLA